MTEKDKEIAEDIIYKILHQKQKAEHLEFLENYMIKLNEVEQKILSDLTEEYFPLDDLKKRLRIEISLRENEGKEKIK